MKEDSDVVFLLEEFEEVYGVALFLLDRLVQFDHFQVLIQLDVEDDLEVQNVAREVLGGRNFEIASDFVGLELQEAHPIVVAGNGVILAMTVDEGHFLGGNERFLLGDQEFDLQLFQLQEVLQIDLQQVLLRIKYLYLVVHVLLVNILVNEHDSPVFLWHVFPHVSEVSV